MRRADLFQPPVVHDGHGVGDGHRLVLVVGHEHHRAAGRRVDAAELGQHGVAQMRVEIGERLVQQQDARPRGKAAGQRHALALAARQLVRPPRAVIVQADQPQRVRDPRITFGAGQPVQPEPHVARHGHGRPQRVGLKHHPQPPPFGRDEDGRSRDLVAAKPQPPGVGPFQPRDQAQKRGLAAAGRSQQGHEPPRAEGRGQAIDGAGRTEAARQVLKADVGHRGRLPPDCDACATRTAAGDVKPRGSPGVATVRTPARHRRPPARSGRRGCRFRPRGRPA